ncbi:MAG: amidohydrolase family protein, partial [Gemmatimonadaceae bacterium]
RLWRVPAAGGAPAEIPFAAALAIARTRPVLPPARFPAPGATQPVRAFMSVALSPDARRVAMLALGALWVMPLDDSAAGSPRPRSVAKVPLVARDLAWSPDGSAVVWSAGRWREEDLYATDLATGATRRLTALPGREAHPAWSPDGRRLLFLHEPAEDSVVARVAEADALRAGPVADTARTWGFRAERGAEAYWAPSSDALLYVTRSFDAARPTRGEIVPLAAALLARAGAGSAGTKSVRRTVRMPDSPLWLQWTAGSLVWVRHARLWRAPFEIAAADGEGMRGVPAPLGADPAIYLSAARDGTLLYLSDGGLRLRRPDGGERRLGWPLAYTPPVAPPLLVRGARVVDGTGRPATPPRDVLVRGGRIAAIAEAGTLDAGGARVLDGAGRWLIPGLMDLHAHGYRPELLPGFAYFGVTTIRDQGSPPGPLVAWADAVAAGRSEGPRVGFGAVQYYSDWAYDVEDGMGVEPEADAGHAARAIALERVFGGQHVKTRTFRRWDIDARFVAEAHRLGLRTTGHCAHQLPLVAAGIDAKEHAGFCEPRGDGVIYDDLVQLYRAAGIGVVPTIVYSSLALRIHAQPDVLERDTELAPFLPPRSDFAWMLALDSTGRREYAGFTATARVAARKLARAGVTLGTGSDVWQTPTGAHMELEELVAAGLTPLEALRAATGDAAKILGADGELGTIAVGKWADLVLLDADPTADVRNTRRIRAVVQAGRVVDRAAIVAAARAGGAAADP